MPRRKETAVLLDSLSIRYADKYLKKFRGKHFVIKCGGSLIENPETGKIILDDVAMLKKEGIHPVLVHGGSVQANNEMKAEGIEPRRYKGLRITCDRTIKVLEKCFGELNKKLVNELNNRGVKAIGFSGRDGDLIQAEKMNLLDGVDLGWVGDMTGIRHDAWSTVTNRQIPVIASLGVGSEGNVLNINADYIATKLALVLKAQKLFLVTDVNGVLLDPENPDTLISSLTVEKARELIENGNIGSGMIPKIESAINTIEQGLPKIHMINGKIPHCILYEIFTDTGIGTEIVP
ncbi:MAG TPA: acetylglutamate kinase [bacterium]|nr:acetylglutamate kinase [bacterium]